RVDYSGHQKSIDVQCAAGFVEAYFFFFQAEDGIRDFHVTGVQTCALPISSPPGPPPFINQPEWDRVTEHLTKETGRASPGSPPHRRPRRDHTVSTFSVSRK